MPLDPDESADQRARRRELEAAGQLGLPEDTLGLDEDEELLDDEERRRNANDDVSPYAPVEDDEEPEDADLEPDEFAGMDPQAVGAAIAGFVAAAVPEDEEQDDPAGAVTTEGRKPWRPSRPKPPTVNPKPPTEPERPIPPTGTGKVVEVRSERDLENMKSGVTYQWVGGFVLRDQLSLSGLNGVTLIDARIEGARESNIYARGCRDLTLTGGDLSRSKTKSGILLDAECEGLRMYRVTGDENEEHFVYVGSHKKGGKPFFIEDCVGRRNHRCFCQVNLEGQSWWVVGGHILRCTADGNATEQGAQFNLGAWDRGLVKDCQIVNGKDDGLVLAAIDGKASKNCRVEACTFKNNRDAPLKTAQGSKGHTLSGCTFDEMPPAGGWRSDGTCTGPGGKRF